MPLLGLLVYLVVAGIVGSVAQFLFGFGRGGFVVAVIIGLLGALLGDWLAAELGARALLPVEVAGETINLVWALIGSMIVLAVLGAVRGRAHWRV